MNTLMKTHLILTLSLLTASLVSAQTLPVGLRLSGTDGRTYTTATLAARPTVMVFLSHGCPHNPKSISDFNRWRTQLGQTVQFVGVLNANAATARSYARELKVNFPVLADPDRKLIDWAGATHSLDFAVLSARRGQLLKRWNGIQRSWIVEATNLLRRNGAPNVRITERSFTSARASGCGL